MKSTARYTLSLPDDLDHALREIAHDHRTQAGVVARALIAFGIENSADPVIAQVIADAVAAERSRRSAIGRGSAKIRYADTPEAKKEARLSMARLTEEPEKDDLL